MTYELFLIAATNNYIDKVIAFAVEVEFKKERFVYFLNLIYNFPETKSLQKHDLLYLLTSNIFGFEENSNLQSSSSKLVGCQQF